MDPKAEMRTLVRQIRSGISLEEKTLKSQKLLSQLMPLLNSTTKVAIYYSIGTEISLDQVINYCLSNSIQIFRPIATKASRKMRFEKVSDNDHHEIFCGTDYKLSNEIKWYNLDLVLIPLLAIDKNGFRLGQGGGYYDTTFMRSKGKPVLCGVGYNWQLYNEVPREDWDLQLDYFASDKQLIKIIK